MSKVLQYFGNMRHKLATVEVFAEIMKVTNYAGLCDAWNSPNLALNDLKNSLGIYSFRLTWPSLFIAILATQVKFLQPSG